MMLRVGLHIMDESAGVNWRICHICLRRQMVAVADMTHALSRNNAKKPKVFSLQELQQKVSSRAVKTGLYKLPREVTLSADSLRAQNRSKWIDKRNRRFELIRPLTDDETICNYIYGNGIGREIQELIEAGSECKTAGAYYNALNRYIVFGMNINALTPFGLKRTGSNFSYVDENGEPIKRGRGGRDNRGSLSKSRGVTEQDKRDIVHVIKQLGGRKKKFSRQKAYRNYYRQFGRTELSRRNPITGVKETIFIGLAEEERISKQQFIYHFDQLLDPKTRLLVIHGRNAFEKDFADKQGNSHAGVLGATYNYEVDTTVLGIYVRYPYDNSGRYSMGRPVLYLVVDVYSTAIAGFYLGFDGPNWQGMANAYINACMDKVEFAKRYGLDLAPEKWPIHHIPSSVLADNGCENTDALINSVLLEQIGIKTFSLTAAYRGDLKGVVEGTFNTIDNERIQYLAGSIFKTQDRTDQHPSNTPFWDYDALIRKLITIIVEYNNSADRLSKQNINMMRDNVGITPQAIFNYNLNEEQNGGNPTTPDDEATIYWAFLPEEQATVRSDCVYFRGLEYHSPELKKRGFYAKASQKRFKITVKRTLNSVNQIWYQADDDQYIPLSLKNTNNESPYLNQCWEAVLHRIEQNRIIRHQNSQQALEEMNSADQLIAPTVEAIKEELKSTPPNTRRSMQPGIKKRKKTQIAIQQAQDTHNLARALNTDEGMPSPPAPSLYHDDTDDDVYG